MRIRHGRGFKITPPRRCGCGAGYVRHRYKRGREECVWRHLVCANGHLHSGPGSPSYGAGTYRILGSLSLKPWCKAWERAAAIAGMLGPERAVAHQRWGQSYE